MKTLAGVNPLDNLRIVLVNTTHPGNIGAAARAMKNMGLSELYLVAPLKFPADEATWRASNAADVLERAVVVETFDDAIADCGLVIGSSARERTIPWPLLDARRACEQAYREASKQKVALVFGREDRGLTNEELQKCQLHINIPSNAEYSSLNVAMAVQVIAYELRMAHLANDQPIDVMADWDFPFAQADDIERFYTHLEQTLSEMGFLKADAPKQTSARLRRMFQRTRLDAMEINMLRGILSSAQYWVKKARGENS
ncbi:MAG: methyltransferase, TrmH family, group 1 [Verrucomicrobiaceae bacterium]|nr:methyltransferase, TrmH family, group 1 [Verrucomicrobiaceae bacterium]